MPAQKAKTKKKTVARRQPARKPSSGRARAPQRAAPSRAPKTLRLSSVAAGLTVNDLDASLAWYVKVLGFTVEDRWERNGKLVGVELAAGRVTVYLGQDDWKKGRDRTKGEGFRLYASTTQDIDALAAQVEARGGSLLEEPHDQPWGGRAFAVADPDGFKITIAND